VETVCSNAASCTRVAFGPCGGVASPEFYLQQEVQGFALIMANDSAYMTNFSELSASVIANNTYRAIDGDLTLGDATYARITAGQYVGRDPSVSGGYIGMASYLLKNGTISTNVNDFLVPDGPELSTTKTKSACISELEMKFRKSWTSTCGRALTYKTGDFKFSLFGFTTGSSFVLPNGVTYLGIRTKLTKKNFPADVEVTFNGKAKKLDGSTAIGTSDVTSVELAGTSRSFTINFPEKYNVGSIGYDGYVSTPTATKDVMIKVAAVDGDADSIYVDYLFDAADLQAAGKYFVYDPTVSEVATVSTATASTTKNAVYDPPPSPGSCGSSDSCRGCSSCQGAFRCYVTFGCPTLGYRRNMSSFECWEIGMSANYAFNSSCAWSSPAAIEFCAALGLAAGCDVAVLLEAPFDSGTNLTTPTPSPSIGACMPPNCSGCSGLSCFKLRVSVVSVSAFRVSAFWRFVFWRFAFLRFAFYTVLFQLRFAAVSCVLEN
ncbi:unnamed protein product, partial [Polarella glacialis]